MKTSPVRRLAPSEHNTTLSGYMRVTEGREQSVIDTDELSSRLRERSIRPETEQLLMARIGGSEQEYDLTEPPNCAGYGRIRHFHMKTPCGWPANPLPMQPAASRLNLPVERVMNAQVFQNAACNWRGWYCYVPFKLLAANERHAGWLSVKQLVALYLAEKNRAVVLAWISTLTPRLRHHMTPDLSATWLILLIVYKKSIITCHHGLFRCVLKIMGWSSIVWGRNSR